MLSFRSFSIRAALCLSAFAFAPACTKGDVGAPCNHGEVQTPKGPKVSFPITDCNDNLCVYTPTPMAAKEDCNSVKDCGPETIWQCEDKKCSVNPSFVLANSMCSRRCNSDADCKDDGIFNKITHEGTSCEKGFICRIFQKVGPMCCTPLCVCTDQPTENYENDCGKGKGAGDPQVIEMCVNTNKG